MLRTLSAPSLLAAILTPCLAQPVSKPPIGSCALVANVDGFRNTKGAAGGTLFQSPDGWPEQNDKAFRLTHSDINDHHAQLRFDNLPPGHYAVAVIHDENSNKKLDRNFFRVPKEGFGFANNPRVTFSAPAFNAAAINVACPETVITIHLIYK